MANPLIYKTAAKPSVQGQKHRHHDGPTNDDTKRKDARINRIAIAQKGYGFDECHQQHQADEDTDPGPFALGRVA